MAAKSRPANEGDVMDRGATGRRPLSVPPEVHHCFGACGVFMAFIVLSDEKLYPKCGRAAPPSAPGLESESIFRERQGRVMKCVRNGREDAVNQPPHFS